MSDFAFALSSNQHFGGDVMSNFVFALPSNLLFKSMQCSLDRVHFICIALPNAPKTVE